jgi:DNA-binding MarR family transcriptional regulator
LCGDAVLDKTRHVGKAIRSVNNVLMRRFDSNRPDKEALARITNANRWVIGYLTEQQMNGKDVYQRDLETAFSVTRSTVSKVIDLMIKKGFIVRQTAAHDARLKRLVLTPKALELSEKMCLYAEGMEKVVTAGFTQEEIDTLLAYLERIKNNLGSD